MFTTTLPMVISAVLAAKLVAASPAIVTLNVPVVGGGDSSAIPAAILGVDSQGRTTYALNENEMQGSSTIALATATLVEGSDYFSYTLSSPPPLEVVIGFDCPLKDGGAVCTGVDDNSQAITSTLSLEPLVLDITSTAGGGASAGSGASASKTPTPGGSASTSAPTSQPSKPSSSRRVSASFLAVTMIGLSLAYLV
ncbi:hypothetical protein MVEN_00449500 [Mycena venus]|uniref:GPI anchored protein n=1 Tax=Mycena venus TaxID=2733690 RepID=A0A8H7DAM8_9AGAR|nr:hypothetical protein MVEN_00449500 [Mycena venus]